jgi:hypothetical protein
MNILWSPVFLPSKMISLPHFNITVVSRIVVVLVEDEVEDWEVEVEEVEKDIVVDTEVDIEVLVDEVETEVDVEEVEVDVVSLWVVDVEEEVLTDVEDVLVD